MTKPTHPQLGDGVTVDVQQLIDSRLLVQANSGGGKSYLVRKLCEITYGHAQVIVLDPDGEFHTLREKFDFALAGPGGECPATVKSAPLLARRLLELGTSCVIDIYELGAQRAAFIAAFLDSLMSAPRDLWHDVIVVVDEVNKFCPEGGRRDKLTEESTNAIIDLMTRGRKRGYCGILATQRISDLNKSAAAECNNVLIGRCNLDIDIDRAAKRIGMNPRQATEVLPELPAGTFYAMGPAISVDWLVSHRVAKIQVGKVTTTHPKRGQKVAVAPPRAMVKKVLAQLADIPEEAAEEANTVVELKAEIVKQRALVRKLTDAAAHGPKDAKDKTAPLQRQLESVKAAWEGMKRKCDERDQYIDDLRAARKRDAKAYKVVYDFFEKLGRDWRATSEAAALPATARSEAIATSSGVMVVSTKQLTEGPGIAIASKTQRPIKAFTHGESKPATTNGAGNARQRVIDTIALLERLGIPLEKETIAVWYGQHPESKGFRNYLSALRSDGLIDADLRLTASGLKDAQSIEIPSEAELQARIMRPLQNRERDVLQFVIDTGNSTREEIAQHLGCHPESKGYRNIISKLRTRGLLTKGWPVKPSPALFMPETN